MKDATPTAPQAGLVSSDTIEDDKHIVFRLANELYGAPLAAIREIIKMQPIKPVPFMVEYFRGILNLRGLIVSVIDLRIKLHLPCQNVNTGLLVVVDTAEGPIGAIVDDVVSVYDFPKNKIETHLALKTRIPAEFFIGVAHMDDRLVNIINIGATLTSDDFAIVRRTRDATSSSSFSSIPSDERGD